MKTDKTKLIIATLVGLSIAGCAGIKSLVPTGPNSSAQISSIIVNDAQSASIGLQNIMNSVEKQYPNMISKADAVKINADLVSAVSVSNELKTGAPAASQASNVNLVLGYINDVLNVVGSPPINGLIPSPFNTAVAAVAFIAPELEGFVQSYVGTAGAGLASVDARTAIFGSSPVMITNLNQARGILSDYVH